MQKKLASVLGSMSAFTLVVTAVCWAQDLAQPPKSPPIEQNLEDDLFTIPNLSSPGSHEMPCPEGHTIQGVLLLLRRRHLHLVSVRC